MEKFIQKWGDQEMVSFTDYMSKIYEMHKNIESLICDDFDYLTAKYVIIVEEIEEENTLKYFIRNYFILFVWLFDRIILFTNGKIYFDYQQKQNKAYIHPTKIFDFTTRYEERDGHKLSIMSSEGCEFKRKELGELIKANAKVIIKCSLLFRNCFKLNDSLFSMCRQ